MAQKMQAYDETRLLKSSPLSTTGIPRLCVAFDVLWIHDPKRFFTMNLKKVNTASCNPKQF